MRDESVVVDDRLVVDPALTLLPPTVADALVRPDETAAALTLLEPGPSAVEALASLQAKQQEFLAEIARRDPAGPSTCAMRFRVRSSWHRPRRRAASTRRWR